MNNNVIGEISVEVKTQLSVDNHTFNICRDLISIRAKNDGVKAFVLIIPEDDNTDCETIPIFTEDGLNMMFDGLDASDAEQEEREGGKWNEYSRRFS